MGDVGKFFLESIEFNWEMLQSNPNYYLDLKSISATQKIDELYDMYIYFLEVENYNACFVVSTQIKVILDIYKLELYTKGVFDEQIKYNN